jgi:hypothetical protein
MKFNFKPIKKMTLLNEIVKDNLSRLKSQIVEAFLGKTCYKTRVR